ncbi:hypothetical protein ACFE04_023669 [Oxalis oulophora]
MMSFTRFYETWFEQLHNQVKQLIEAPRQPTNPDNRHQMESLVQRLMSHYGEYYGAKSLAAEKDVLLMFAAPWATSLERSLHWIAGWRPTTVFHLVYTESSILFESHIVDILRGFRTGDLGDLSPTQFRRVSELQCETVNEENAITDELAEWQDEADELRMRTIRSMVELLTAHQAVEFLIAAAELQFGVRCWGSDQDRQRRNNNV